MDTIKQVIVMRTDTAPPMRRGKQIAQGAHASIAFLTKRLLYGDINEKDLTKAEKEWLISGQTKICVRVDSEEEFHSIHLKAIQAGLQCNKIKDSGKTEFKEPTYTCLAIGPDYSSKIDLITGQLKLL
jgi:PTH2 family peptidyl-tRNA hydrolase